MRGGRLAALAGRMALAALSFAVALGAVEFALRIRAPYLIGSHQHPSDVSRDELEEKPGAFVYDELLGWRLKPNQQVPHQEWEFKYLLETNSRGLRDGEVSYDRRGAGKRILLLGDSFGMGYGVEAKYSFAALLEEKLPATEVVNLSVSAYGTDQELLLYRAEGKRYDVDVVMMALTVSNDFADIIKDRSFVFAKPRFALEEGRLVLGGVPPPLPGRADVPGRASVPFVSPAPLHDFLDRHSALYAFGFERLSRHESLRKRFETMELLYPQIDIYSSDQIGVLSRVPSPEQERTWALMLALVDAWRREVIENGDEPVLALIPAQLQASVTTWERVAARYRLPPERYDPSYPHQRLKRFGADRGLAVIDLLPPLQAETGKGRSFYFRQNPHWNRFGHEFAAELIAAELRALGLI